MKLSVLPIIGAVLLLGACASQQTGHPATAVDGVRKVIESLSADIGSRLATDPFRNLPVVVESTNRSGTGIEPMIAELLRTRLVERGVAVDHSCQSRCFQVTLQELVIDSPRDPSLSPGQLISVAGGSIPVIGGLVRNLGEREQEKRRAENRASGVLVTYAAREGNRYTARHTVVAITSAGDVALESK